MIRLRGGSGPHDGYVEVQGTNPGWGIVCDARNSWTLKEAHVVCKQLGYYRYFIIYIRIDKIYFPFSFYIYLNSKVLKNIPTI